MKRSVYWSRLVQQTTPYVPGEQPAVKDMLKLNTNENPYPPSPRVRAAIQGAADDGLRLYPDPEATQLRATIAAYYGMEAEQVFVGNGSDEVLAFAFASFFNPGETIRFPDITYSFYPVYAQLFQLDYELVPLAEDFTIPVEAMGDAPGGVIFPNPNAPTSLLLPLDAVEHILRANRERVVIVDEAYIDFGGQSAVSLIPHYENLLVIQTLSKSRALAGLRVGFAMGNGELIEALVRIKNSFNSYPVDRLAQAGAIVAFQDEAYFQRIRQKIMATRERVTEELAALGFQVLPSQANFIFITHGEVEAEQLFTALKGRQIYVRYFPQPRINQYLRVSIGTDEEMDQLLVALKEILHSFHIS